MTWIVLALVLVGLALVAWGWFEAGWLRRRVVEVELAGVPAELDGLRIAHLSDLHLGVPSRGRRAVAQAVDWVIERKPDLVCITGDLVSRRSGMARARAPPGQARARATSCSATTTSPTAATLSRSASIPTLSGESTGSSC